MTPLGYSAQGSGAPIPTFKYLDDIIAILGSTKTTFFPFLENVGGDGFAGIWSYKRVQTWLNSQDEGGSVVLQTEMSPYRHVGGIHSYDLDPTGDHYLRGQDEADFSFASNAPCSFGIWIKPTDITTVTLMAKYDEGADQEFKLSLDASSKIELEVYDETNNEDRTGASDTAIVIGDWSLVIATYDGADDDGSMTFYLNGAADGAGNTASDAAFASMVAGGSPLAIGAHFESGGAPKDEFKGRLALPFLCGKELSAGDVSGLHVIGQKLLGLV